MNLSLDNPQTISNTYSFGSPTSSIKFEDDIILKEGGGVSLNGQSIDLIKSSRKIWKTVGAVKSAAHGEAYALCNQVLRVFIYAVQYDSFCHFIRIFDCLLKKIR